MIEARTRKGARTKEGARRLFLDPERSTARWTLGAARKKSGRLVFHHVLLELFEELLGFRKGQPQLFDLLGVFVQHSHLVLRFRLTLLSTDDQLHPELYGGLLHSGKCRSCDLFSPERKPPPDF